MTTQEQIQTAGAANPSLSNRATQEQIQAAVAANPTLSNRALAKLAGVAASTLAKARRGVRSPLEPRYEASGKRARGARPTPVTWEQLPGGGAVLYRLYCRAVRERVKRKGVLLYIGVSLTVAQRRARQSPTPWWHQVTLITMTHYAAKSDALHAERRAIEREKPVYNVIPEPSIAHRPKRRTVKRPQAQEQRRERLLTHARRTLPTGSTPAPERVVVPAAPVVPPNSQPLIPRPRGRTVV